MRSQGPQPSCLCMALGPSESSGEASLAPLPKQATRYVENITAARTQFGGWHILDPHPECDKL